MTGFTERAPKKRYRFDVLTKTRKPKFLDMAMIVLIISMLFGFSAMLSTKGFAIFNVSIGKCFNLLNEE